MREGKFCAVTSGHRIVSGVFCTHVFMLLTGRLCRNMKQTLLTTGALVGFSLVVPVFTKWRTAILEVKTACLGCATFVEHVLFHAQMDGDSGRRRRLGKIPHLLGSDGMELNTRVREALTKVMEDTSAPEMETVSQVIVTEVVD